jgi:hypothetical protein
MSAFTRAAEENAPSPLEGIWKWTFTMPDGGQVNPRIKFKTEKNALAGVARFRPGTDTPVTNMVFTGNEVSFDVARGRDGQTITTHYAGRIEGDKINGKVTSNWAGETQSYDWRAERSNDLDGTWKWRLEFGGRGIDQSMTLKRENERVTGKLHLGRGGEPDIHHGRFRNNQLSFEVYRERDGEKTTNYYRGKLTGDRITGTYTSSFGQRRTNEWHASRAD